MARQFPSIILPLLLISGTNAATFTLTNSCDYTVWPGVLASAGTSPLSTTGFVLQKGASVTLTAPGTWSGRFWGRSLCSTDSTGKFTCVTGDCGSGKLECSGSGAAPPATLAEFTLGGSGGLDFYDVSLVDGYNLPMLVVAQGGSGNCSMTGCIVNLNEICPSELRITSEDDSIACKSACEAFGEPKYCCSGEYGNPSTCNPSSYSQFFKHACPRAYSYAYDDGTSTFTCASADYVITFCPPIPSQKSQGGGDYPLVTELPLINDTMVFQGAANDVSAAPRTVSQGRLIAVAVAILAAIWRFSQLYSPL